MAEILLTNGGVAKVDDADAARLTPYRWHQNGGYARRWSSHGGRRRIVLMHREVLADADAPEIDHLNGDGLDNRRANLRPCSHAQNMMNRRGFTRRKSAFKGVWWCPSNNGKSGSFRAKVRANGQSVSRRFASETEAAEWYALKARELHGSFFRDSR